MTNPIVILRELFIHLEQQCHVFPEYSTLQDILGKELRNEEKRLCSLVAKWVTHKTATLLDKLLTFEDFSYEITSLKQHPKNFNYNQIQQELEKHKTYYYHINSPLDFCQNWKFLSKTLHIMRP